MDDKQKEEGGATPRTPVQKEVNGMTKEMFVCPMTKQIFNTKEELEKHWSQYRKVEYTQAVIDLQFQPYIMMPPGSPDPNGPPAKDILRDTYSRNDKMTVESWLKEWQKDKVRNWKDYEPVKNSLMKEFQKFAYKPVICAGSGPSLKKNAHLLKKRGQVGLISALHNFGYFESIGVKADYYVNLDAGDITIAEMGEGDPEIWKATEGMSNFNRAQYLDDVNYWEKTKKHTLLANLHSNPQLIKKWQGKIRWFDTPLQGLNESIEKEAPGITKFNILVQTGGNTLGASHYIAKIFLGASQLVFIGADFSFSYDKKFHSWASPYDQQFSGLMDAVDVFGQRVKTWGSYYGFKTWFEHVALGGISEISGTYTNCTEGGILGSYPGGNIVQIRQRTLADFLKEVTIHEQLPDSQKDGNLNVFY